MKYLKNGTLLSLGIKSVEIIKQIKINYLEVNYMLRKACSAGSKQSVSIFMD